MLTLYMSALQVTSKTAREILCPQLKKDVEKLERVQKSHKNDSTWGKKCHNNNRFYIIQFNRFFFYTKHVINHRYNLVRVVVEFPSMEKFVKMDIFQKDVL